SARRGPCRRALRSGASLPESGPGFGEAENLAVFMGNPFDVGAFSGPFPHQRIRSHLGNTAPRYFEREIQQIATPFFLPGTSRPEDGLAPHPLRKRALSYRSKKTNNPNPSPIGNGFGL